MLDCLNLGLVVVEEEEEEEEEEEVEEEVMDLAVVVGGVSSIRKLRLQVFHQAVEESFKSITLGHKARPHMECRFHGLNYIACGPG